MSLEPAPLNGAASVARPEARAAAIHLADRVAAEHPADDRGSDDRNAGRRLAYDRSVRADLLDLLDALGITPDQITRRGTA